MTKALVVLNSSTKSFDKKYCYNVPQEFLSCIIPGVRAVVPFGNSNRLVQGIVVKVGDFEVNHPLKNIKSLLDVKPILSEELMSLLEWMTKRYICTYSDVLKCMLPFGAEIKLATFVQLAPNYSDVKLNASQQKIVNNLSFNSQIDIKKLKHLVNLKNFTKNLKALEDLGIITLTQRIAPCMKEKRVKVAYIIKTVPEITKDIENNILKKIQHIKVLELLMEVNYAPITDIIRFTSASTSVLNTLKNNKYIAFKYIETTRTPLEPAPIKISYPLPPTLHQQNTISTVKKTMDSSIFSEFLLHGITGSGKTEVYLQLIQYCLDCSKQAILLVPEISLTPQMVEHFHSRFGNNIAVLHSRLSLGERYDQWRLIKNQSVHVVVGARSAIFAPLERLGIIIIDEEHELTYKSEVTPKYHALEVARERCTYSKCPLLYGSATPCEERYYLAKTNKIKLLDMPYRTNQSQLPNMQIIDMREELSAGNKTMFSRQLLTEIEENLARNEQSIIFMNKRGFSSFVLCRSCGYVVKCRSCDTTMTYHLNGDRLICHYCGYTVKNPSKCPSCSSKYIKTFGAGTQKIEQELSKLFPSCSIIRMDLDTTSKKHSFKELLTKFRDGNADILVGTQMIAKGHHFPQVTLVGMISADISLNICDYRASERTFQLITQVAGRAGRTKLKGRVIVQTYNPDNYSIISACNHDFKMFYEKDINIRKKLFLPPFCHIGTVLVSSNDDKAALQVSNDIASFIIQKYVNTNMLGPCRPPITRIKDKYRWRIIIKHSDLDILIDMLTDLSNAYYKQTNSADITIDINPNTLM